MLSRANWRWSLRLTGREWLAGELTLLWLALLLAVTAVSGVSLFTDRVQQAMQQGADRLLAADLALSADHPLPERWRRQAEQQGLRQAELMLFPSMALAGEQAQLVSVKAATSNYPLRGQLRLQQRGVVGSGPARGEAWADPRLFALLGLAPGGSIQLGELRLRLTASIAREPDAVFEMAAVAPRLLINAADVPATRLIQPGSRVRYRLLLAGEADVIQRYRAWAQPGLAGGEKIEDIRDARPELRQTLQRAERFLRLAAMLTVLLAAAAMSLAGRRYVSRHLDQAALLRSLGASRQLLRGLLWRQSAILLLSACTGGLLLGGLLQAGIAQALAGFDGSEPLPPPSLWPLLTGGLTGLVLLLAFTWPQLWQLADVPPLRVLRRDMAPSPRVGALTALGLAALAALISWQAGEAKQAGLALAGFALTLLATAALAWLATVLASRWRPPSPALRFGLHNLRRRRGLTVLQVSALALGLFTLLLLLVVRQDLFAAWQRQIPADAPNRFVINIQPEQRQAVQAVLQQHGLPPPPLQPMLRARLIAIDGRPLRPETFRDAQTRHLAEREFNLSWGDSLRNDNRLLTGRPLNELGQEFSMESEIAGKLGVRLGSQLTFDLGGVPHTAPVVNLRKVNWDSFRVNFFVTGSQHWLGQQPASYLTSFYLSPGRDAASTALLRTMPNLTLIDVGAVLAEVRHMLLQASQAVELVFLLSLVAGLLVLLTATLSTQDERRREAAVLRTLGASRRQIRLALLAELAAIGGLAGLVAGVAAMLLGAAAAAWLFDLPGVTINGWLPLLGLGGGLSLTVLASWPLLAPVWRTPPLAVLRSE